MTSTGAGFANSFGLAAKMIQTMTSGMSQQRDIRVFMQKMNSKKME
jgi:hypothetical protein